MVRNLLDTALAHAERADRPVQAAIWLRAARVMTKLDRSAAERLIERGVTVARALELSDREPIMHTAVSMAATVTPALAIALAGRELNGHMQEGALSQAFFHMADHGLVDEAAAILSDPPEELPFPFTGVTNVIAGAKDENTRRRILESVVRAYRRGRETRGDAARRGFERHAFVSLFSFHWKRLAPEMALATVRDLLRDALDDPDEPVHASVGPVKFSSSRQHRLFEILGPLRQLDPSMAESLLSGYRQLARAAAVMPFGMYSPVMAAATPQEPARTSEPIEQPDWIEIGNRLIPMPEAIATKFATAFESADRAFEADANGGNAAPKEAWPSAAEYRTILYKAGRHQGPAASEHLERVDDPDLRVLAAIELAAALAGLPQVGGVMIEPGHRRRDRHSAPSEQPPAELAALIERLQRRPLQLPEKPNLPPAIDVRISASARPPGSRMAGGAGTDFWMMEGVPLRPVLAKIYDMPERRIEMPPALERDRFDFTLVLPDDESHETMKRLMRESINRHFRIRVVRESHDRDVYVLTAPAGSRLKPARHAGLSASSIDFTGDVADELRSHDTADLHQIMDLHMAGESVSSGERADSAGMTRMIARDSQGGAMTALHGDFTIADLCEVLEGSLDRFVVDETGLTGSYEFRIETEATSTLAFLDALRDSVGIVATPARREVTLLVVSPA